MGDFRQWSRYICNDRLVRIRFTNLPVFFKDRYCTRCHRPDIFCLCVLQVFAEYEIWLAAENGMYLRYNKPRGSTDTDGQWTPTMEHLNMDWKESVQVGVVGYLKDWRTNAYGNRFLVCF